MQNMELRAMANGNDDQALLSGATAATTYRCAVAVGVAVRRGPIPSDASVTKTVIKNKATINVLPDTVTGGGGREYLALSDGSGFVPLTKTNGTGPAFLTIDQYKAWGGEDDLKPRPFSLSLALLFGIIATSMRGLAQNEGLHFGTGKCQGGFRDNYTEYTFEFSVNTTSYLGIWSASTSYDQASVKLTSPDGPQVPQCIRSIGQSELKKVVPDDTVTDLDCRIAARAPEVPGNWTFSKGLSDCAVAQNTKCNIQKAFSVLGPLAGAADLFGQMLTPVPRIVGAALAVFAGLCYLITFSVFASVFNGSTYDASSTCGLGLGADGRSSFGGSFWLLVCAWILSWVEAGRMIVRLMQERKRAAREVPRPKLTEATLPGVTSGVSIQTAQSLPATAPSAAAVGSFCSSCGVQSSPGAQACHSCGSSMGPQYKSVIAPQYGSAIASRTPDDAALAVY